ncbi:unnamed protein product [Urochloa humidicola]
MVLALGGAPPHHPFAARSKVAPPWRARPSARGDVVGAARAEARPPRSSSWTTEAVRRSRSVKASRVARHASSRAMDRMVERPGWSSTRADKEMCGGERKNRYRQRGTEMQSKEGEKYDRWSHGNGPFVPFLS